MVRADFRIPTKPAGSVVLPWGFFRSTGRFKREEKMPTDEKKDIFSERPAWVQPESDLGERERIRSGRKA